jgi:hypothetical protein
MKIKIIGIIIGFLFVLTSCDSSTNQLGIPLGDFANQAYVNMRVTTINETGQNGTNGIDGINGQNGTNGINGYTPILGIDYFNGTNGTNALNVVYFKLLPETVNVTAVNGSAYFTVPISFNGWNITAVGASVYTVSSSGNVTFGFYNLETGVSILSTNITINSSNLTSYNATTPAVINPANNTLFTGQQIRIDIITAGTGTKGADIWWRIQAP